MRKVDQAHYTEEYFLEHCTEHEVFKSSNGGELGERFQVLLPYLEIKQGVRVLDVGSGRGELCVYAASQGAEVEGVDYADAAVKLARKALRKQPKKIQDRVKYVQAGVTEMELEPDSFDLVVSVEVVEHLYPEQLEVMMEKVVTALKPGGRVVFHTAPNRWFNDYVYRYYCYPLDRLIVGLSNALTGGDYGNYFHPDELRDEVNEQVHVNEPTYFSLQALMKSSGLSCKIMSTNVTFRKPEVSWKDRWYNRIVFLEPLSHRFPVNVGWGNDFLVVGHKI